MMSAPIRLLMFKFIAVSLALMMQTATLNAQAVSVPFTYGVVGTVGNNTGQSDNILNFSTLGVTSATLSQVSATGIFQQVGNNIPGDMTLNFSDGSTLIIPGALNWRITTMGQVRFVGFIPTATGGSTVITYGAGSTYTLDDNSNYALRFNTSTITYADGDDVSGNSAMSGVLDALNDYLATTQANAPNGPVSVDALTTADTTPTITGDATLQAGESLTVEINGVIYSTANGLTITGTSWSVPVPTSLAVATYSVTATIANTDGYTLLDSTIDELTITPPDVVDPVITGPSGAAGDAVSATDVVEGTTAVTTLTADEPVTWDVGGTTFAIDATTGALSFITAPVFVVGGPNDYDAVVTATDAAGNTSTQTVTVTVTPPDVVDRGSR